MGKEAGFRVGGGGCSVGGGHTGAVLTAAGGHRPHQPQYGAWHLPVMKMTHDFYLTRRGGGLTGAVPLDRCVGRGLMRGRR